MDRRIRDALHIAGSSDEYIMSRMVEVSIHIPTKEDRQSGQRRRAFFTAPDEYIKECLTYLRAAAKYLRMEEPSLLSVQHSIDMVLLHWLTHDDLRVWRSPAERVAVGLFAMFFPEVRRVELIHLYDEDTAGKFSTRAPLTPSPLPAAMRDRFAEEWEQMGAFADATELVRRTAELYDGLPDDIDFGDAVRIKAAEGNPVAQHWLVKLAEEEASHGVAMAGSTA